MVCEEIGKGQGRCAKLEWLYVGQGRLLEKDCPRDEGDEMGESQE